MYLVTVLLLTVVLPITSIYAQLSFANTPQAVMVLVGTWFVFWSAGVRLVIDGSLQFFRTKFTAEEIMGLYTVDAIPVVRELGVANLGIGIVGMASIVLPQFALPIAIITAISYGVAGSRRAREGQRTGNETAAMVSDLLVSSVLVLYILYVAAETLIARR